MENEEFAYYFNSVLTKGRKDNTYKFALARFLIDYAHGLDDSFIRVKIEKDEKEIIRYSTIAKLKYYWHQICKYKIRQNYNMEKLPLIVQILQEIFGKEYIPECFQSMDKSKIEMAEKQIERKCFLEVIPRFQNIMEGADIISRKEFYNYHDNLIEVKPKALQYFKQNYSFLFKAVILEWAKFLERINLGLPKLISKIEREEVQRSSLEKVKNILRKYFDRCFYCNIMLSKEKQLIHVDHFIPWSYIFEDELWNLVLTCRTCNLQKHSSLPPVKFVNQLANRNIEYSTTILDLKRSVQRLNVLGNSEEGILKLYQIALIMDLRRSTCRREH